MTATLHFFSSSDRDTHVAIIKSDTGETLVRALFNRSHIVKFQRPNPNAATFSVTAQAMKFARKLALAASTPHQCRNCTFFTPLSDRRDMGLCWNFNRYTPACLTTCSAFQATTADAKPRPLFGGEEPQPGDFYLADKPSESAATRARWNGVLSWREVNGCRDEWLTYRPVPAEWERVAELREGDTICSFVREEGCLAENVTQDMVDFVNRQSYADRAKLTYYRKVSPTEETLPAAPLLLENACP